MNPNFHRKRNVAEHRCCGKESTAAARGEGQRLGRLIAVAAMCAVTACTTPEQRCETALQAAASAWEQASQAAQARSEAAEVEYDRALRDAKARLQASEEEINARYTAATVTYVRQCPPSMFYTACDVTGGVTTREPPGRSGELRAAVAEAIASMSSYTGPAADATNAASAAKNAHEAAAHGVAAVGWEAAQVAYKLATPAVDFGPAYSASQDGFRKCEGVSPNAARTSSVQRLSVDAKPVDVTREFR